MTGIGPGQRLIRRRALGALLLIPFLVLLLLNSTVRIAAVVVAVGLLLVWTAGYRSESRWRRKQPEVPSFARQRPSTGATTIVRLDGNARVWRDDWRFLWRRRTRYWFVGTGCPPHMLSNQAFTPLAAGQATAPALIAACDGRQFWWYQDQFYWERDNLAAPDVAALIAKRARDRRNTLEHARNLVAVEEQGVDSRKRESISEEVRRSVFRRDAGACRQCGSHELLQFDHIIPLVMGGSSEPENLQLLCAPCNRQKSGRI